MKLCECGCGETVNTGRRFIKGHQQRGKPSPNKGKKRPRLPLCECGCGKKVLYPWNKFLPGHHRKGKGKNPVQGPLPLCKCGCGKVVNYVGAKFIYKHHRRLYKKPPVQGPLPLCKYNCGRVVSSIAHDTCKKHRITKPPVQGPLPSCACGCGQVVTKIYNRFLFGHGNVSRNKKLTPRRIYKHKVPETSTDNVDFCKMCNSKDMLSTHHLVPRKYGVNNDEYNLITLCKNCHDKVEILTTDWIDSGREYSSLIFRRLITNMW